MHAPARPGRDTVHVSDLLLQMKLRAPKILNLELWLAKPETPDALRPALRDYALGLDGMNPCAREWTEAVETELDKFETWRSRDAER